MKSLKNMKLLKGGDADRWFSRNFNSLNDNVSSEKIKNLIKINNLKADKILEIGCANGFKLNLYSKLLRSKKNYGIDISKKAIQHGKKNYKNLNLLNISSLEIDKIKLDFDLIICGFYLYHLDRNDIFRQFDLICKKLSQNGFLLIIDFDPLFKHSNKDLNTKNLISYKMSYDNFLTESGLFEVMYKSKSIPTHPNKKKFKSDTTSMTLFRKIDFHKKYPENL